MYIAADITHQHCCLESTYSLPQWWLSSLMQQSGYWTTTSWKVFTTGELPVLLLRTRALQHCPVGRLKINKKIWACNPLQCTVKLSCPASPTFFVASVFYSPSPLLLILPLLGTPLSVLSFFFSAYSPVTPSIISPSSSCLFPQNTALSPVILFWKPAACQVPLTEHQPLARGAHCLAVWAWSPASLGGEDKWGGNTLPQWLSVGTQFKDVE